MTEAKVLLRRRTSSSRLLASSIAGSTPRRTCSFQWSAIARASAVETVGNLPIGRREGFGDAPKRASRVKVLLLEPMRITRFSMEASLIS
ncbi:hypothetical protein BC361_26220 [Ensifer sp. LC54]|nr:hypothetical protein BC363_28605 [Ensifer sp. LC384]OCP21848.1 hypothetical protein BC361_26220 [Ensifer sp. LC54]